MQFMNSSLDILGKNLPDNDFKHLSQEFNGGTLKLVKQKGVYPYDNTQTILKSFLKNNYLIDLNFIVLYKMNVLVKKIIYMLIMFGICLK